MKQRFKCILLAALTVLLVGTAGCGSSAPVRDYTVSPPVVSTGSPFKYHYDQLEPIEQYAYNAVLSVIENFPQEVEVPIMDEQQLHNFYTAMLYDNPSLFFLGNNPTVRRTKKTALFYPQYIMDKSDYAAMLNKCNTAAKTIVLQARKQDSDFDRERIVHDLIVSQCQYSESDNNLYKSSIYGVLCAGSAACEGYAKTAKYILDFLSIPCYVITGNSTPPGAQTQAHMWNIVRIDNDWYHLDLTWDDPVLKKGGSIISHAYFNITDSQIRTTHSNYTSVNACTATQQNYFVHERLSFVDFGAAEKERTVDIATQALLLGNSGFQLKFHAQESYEKAQNTLFEAGEIYPLLQKIRERSSVEFATDRVSYFCSESTFTIEIIVEK